MHILSKVLRLLASLLFVLNLNGQGLFEPNLGQWDHPFSYRLRTNNGAVFIENDGFRFHFTANDLHVHRHEADHSRPSAAFKLQFIGGQIASTKSLNESDVPTHYYLGDNPSNWKKNVHSAQSLELKELYKGVDVILSTIENGMKYDFVLAAGCEPDQIRYRFDGVDRIRLKKGKLQIETSIGDFEEYIPRAYQEFNGEQKLVKCEYTLSDDGIIGFELGDYNKQKPLVIDPILVFAGFSASSADNWGFTATYDDQGNLYGGGISFGIGYPATLGSFSQFFNGGVIDVAITKFNSDGTQALYSTYIGGSGNEQPHSLVVDGQGNLIVLGITSSNNFPVPNSAYQSVFQGGTSLSLGGYGFGSGTDIFLAKLSNDGSQMLAGTYFGGSLNDGVNEQFALNYADEFRGEVNIDDQDNIYIASVTLSADVVMPNGFQAAMGGWQDALIASFPPDLQGIRWGTYYGGNFADNANALEWSTDGSLYVVGGARSGNIQMSPNAISNNLNGVSDGYILRLDAADGSFLNASYIGSNDVDQVYLVDSDRYGFVYIVGQTFGVMPISAGVFSQAPGGQFIQKLSGDLSQRSWATVIGNGNVPNMSPTAFLVDDCLNIYLSGWGGVTNSANLGQMDNMPLSPDAFQSTSDGSEFYFIVLEENARALQFASYYGGQANEHVDAGTSRFSPDGTIYQAVCAGCGNQTFPTTPGVYGPNNNSSNCNLGVIKIDFESIINAATTIDLTFVGDTVCDTLVMRFNNNSFNANQYLWDFGNGRTSDEIEPIARFDTLGTYKITLIAIDTLCGSSDTASLIFEHDRGSKPLARFETNYVSCDPNRPAQFNNTSEDAQEFLWNFDDGSTATGTNPSHRFTSFGTYSVEMIAIDTLCGSSDTTTYDIIFDENSFSPSLSHQPPDCNRNSSLLQLDGVSDSVSVKWVMSTRDTIIGGSTLDYSFPNSGSYSIRLEIQDTICNDSYIIDTVLKVENRIDRLFIPNVFTPNKDGLNEVFKISGDECYANSRFIIFNRWGEKVFESNLPFEQFWNGIGQSSEAPQGVYQWVFIHNSLREYGTITLLR